MFEYILLIQICSQIDRVCMESTKFPKPIETHYECLTKGYELGLEISKSLKPKDANQKRIFVTFSCTEIEKLTS